MIAIKVIGCILGLVIIYLMIRFAAKVSSKEHEREESRKQYLKENPPKEEPVRCPKCGSAQITFNKKGFSAGKAVTGAVIAGGIGIAAGGIGSNKIICTCLKCGHQFKPKDQL